MVRTIVTPDHANIELSVPDDYIGKQIEILMYTIDEGKIENKVSEKLVSPLKASDFKGVLSKKSAEELQKHVKESREAWKNRI